MERSNNEKEEIYSKVMRAGRRTYFFDVRSTRADDFYLTITESKKHTNEDGSAYYKKHKIYLYKEDFQNFKDILNEVTDYIIDKRGDEVISETHQSDFKKEYNEEETEVSANAKEYTDVKFEDF